MATATCQVSNPEPAQLRLRRPVSRVGLNHFHASCAVDWCRGRSDLFGTFAVSSMDGRSLEVLEFDLARSIHNSSGTGYMTPGRHAGVDAEVTAEAAAETEIDALVEADTTATFAAAYEGLTQTARSCSALRHKPFRHRATGDDATVPLVWSASVAPVCWTTPHKAATNNRHAIQTKLDLTPCKRARVGPQKAAPDPTVRSKQADIRRFFGAPKRKSACAAKPDSRKRRSNFFQQRSISTRAT